MAKNQAIQLTVAYYMGDDGEVTVESGTYKRTFDNLKQGTQVSVPVGVVDGKRFMTHPQLLSHVMRQKKAARKKAEAKIDDAT